MSFLCMNLTSSRPLVYRKFLASDVDGLVDGLVGTYWTARTRRKPIQNPGQPPPQNRLVYVDPKFERYPDSKTNRCKVCYARGGKKKVRYCRRRGNVALCVVGCFWDYHTLVGNTVPV